MSAAKLYIVRHMERYCGPLYCLPDEVRNMLSPNASVECSKTIGFYFAVFCSRNGIPIDLCIAYAKAFGLARNSGGMNHIRRVFGETTDGVHHAYYAFICDANSCVDPASGEKIGAKYSVGKTSSFHVYNEQKKNREATGNTEKYGFYM